MFKDHLTFMADPQARLGPTFAGHSRGCSRTPSGTPSRTAPSGLPFVWPKCPGSRQHIQMMHEGSNTDFCATSVFGRTNATIRPMTLVFESHFDRPHSFWNTMQNSGPMRRHCLFCFSIRALGFQPQGLPFFTAQGAARDW